MEDTVDIKLGKTTAGNSVKDACIELTSRLPHACLASGLGNFFMPMYCNDVYDFYDFYESR